ncbi:MAG TPA: hypothetical protein DHV62_03590 [Elusimicrobia bacterium]|jgi:DNA-binding response OmpR family regulator|nr:hypothetical protein [Elusimicrobiota bacterium]
MKQKILVIDDEKNVCESVKATLDDFQVDYALTAGEGIEKAKNDKPDLIILDLAFPGEMDGWDICETLKADKETEDIPIVMLTGEMLKKEDEIKGLEMGAEDYIKKPFDTDIFRARIRRVINRANLEKTSRRILKRGDVNLYTVPLMAKIGRRKIYLPPKQFEFLYLLMLKQGKVVTREYLCRTLWECESKKDSEDRSIEMTVKKLRANLGPKDGKRIKTVKNKGYLFV